MMLPTGCLLCLKGLRSEISRICSLQSSRRRWCWPIVQNRRKEQPRLLGGEAETVWFSSGVAYIIFDLACLMLREITLLEEKDRNPKVSVNEANQQQKGRFAVPQKQVWYYAYNHDVNDKGWGCAWRAIQTLISTTQVQLGFAQMFVTFSRKELLIKTLQEHRNPSEDLLKILRQHKWAPEELGNNWAQPFIGALVSWYHKLPNQLLLVNKYPQGMAHAPQGVFQRIIPFKQFSQLIKNNIERTVFMIDDGNYALSIVGYSEPDPNFIELLFADPHISSNRQHRDVGLYAIRYNLEGEPQGQTRNQHQIKQSSHSVFDKLTFKDKPWMVCYLK